MMKRKKSTKEERAKRAFVKKVEEKFDWLATSTTGDSSKRAAQLAQDMFELLKLCDDEVKEMVLACLMVCLVTHKELDIKKTDLIEMVDVYYKI